MTRLATHVVLLAVGSTIAFSADVAAQERAKSPKSPGGFPLPDGAIHRFGNRQLRHPEEILSVVVSPDGNLLATTGEANIIVWDLTTLAARRVFPVHHVPEYDMVGGDANPCHVAFTADSKSLVTLGAPPGPKQPGGDDNPEPVASIWNIETGERKSGPKGYKDHAMAVWTTAGGKEIAVVSSSLCKVWFFDAAGKEVHKVDMPQFDGSIHVAPTANLIAGWATNRTGRDGPHLVVCDARTGKEQYAVPSKNKQRSVLSADGKMMVAVDEEGKVQVHDLESKKELFAFSNPAGQNQSSMRISADRKVLYLSARGGELYRWDLVNNRRLPDIGRQSKVGLTHFALSPDEATLYVGGSDGLVRRWDLKAGKKIAGPDGYDTRIAMALHPDGKHLFVADRSGRIDKWEIATGRLVTRLQDSGKQGINCLGVSTDGRWLACGRTIAEIDVMDLGTAKMHRLIPAAKKSPQGNRQLVERVRFSTDGRMLFTGVDNEGVTGLEVASGKKLWNRPMNGYNLGVDPRGRWVVTGIIFDPPVRVAIVDAQSGNLARAMVIEPTWAADGEILDPSQTYDRAFTPDGSRVVTVQSDGTTRVWSVETGKELVQMKWDHNARMEPGGLAIAPDGKWIATREDRRILIWETASGVKLHTIPGSESTPLELAFTRSGREIIANADLAPVLWSLQPKDLPAIDGSKDALWEQLASTDGPTVYRLQWALASNPKEAVALFSLKAKAAAELIDRARFDKLVAALDSPQFRARETAERELVQARHKVPVEWLQKALAAAKSDEQSTRLGRVLIQREKPSAEELRFSRAIQVLELARTGDAKELLRTWSAATGSTLVVEAKAALDRMGAP